MQVSRNTVVLLLVGFLLPARFGAAASKKDASKEAVRREAIEHYLRARLYGVDGEFEASLKEFRKAVDLDPNDGSLRREYAEALRDLSVYAEAEREARKAVELSPGNPGAHRVLGQVLLATAKDRKSVELAASELKAANDVLPGDPVGAIAYGQALLRLDKPQEAAAVLEAVLERGRGSAVQLLYGEALEKSGQLEAAEELYSGLLKLDPENGAASMALLRVYEKTRKFEKGIPLVEGFLKKQPANLGLKTQYGLILLRARRFPEAGKALKEVLDADPGNRDGLRHYATLLSETLETDKADEVLRKLQELEPDDPEIPFRRALNFLEAHRLVEAEKVLRELRAFLVVKKKGEGELAQVDGQLAYTAYLRKDYQTARDRVKPHLFDDEQGVNLQALNLLLQIARDEKDDAEGLRLAREAHGKAKKNQTVSGALAEFLTRSPDAAQKAEGEKILESLAREDKAGALTSADAWQRLERFDRAVATARSALQTFPNDPELLFRLAASLERDKKIPESVAAFEKLLAVKSDHAAALNYLGYLWADRGENLSRALDLIQKAVSLDPSNGAYLDSLGWVYYQLNRLDLAEQNLQAAALLNPDDATVAEHLGDLFEKRGEVAQARAQWKKALTLKPEDGGKKIEQKLRRTEGRAANSLK